MNMFRDYDPKLVETLKSLSLDDSPQTATLPAPKCTRRRFQILLSLLLASAVILTGGAFWAGGVDELITVVRPDRTDTQTQAASPSSVPVPQPSAAVSGIHTPVPTQQIVGSGFVVAPRRTSVFTKYQGRVTSIDVNVGDHVKAGQSLIRLEDESAQFSLETAFSEKKQADLELDAKNIKFRQTTADLHRMKELVARQAFARQELEKADMDNKSARNAVEQAKQKCVDADRDIRIAQEHVDALVIKAPISGTITEMSAHVGELVASLSDSGREGQSLLSITDMTNLVIDADVAENNISALRTGLRGKAVLDGIPDQPFEIEIIRLAPVANAEKGTISLRLALHHAPDRIRPNMAARIHFQYPAEVASQ